MPWRVTLASSLSGGIRKQLLSINAEDAKLLTEIRVRAGQHLRWVFSDGRQKEGKRITQTELDELVVTLCGHSRYAYETQMARGYIPLAHGHRAGVCGQVVYEDGHIVRMSCVTSVCIRIARQQPNASRPIREYLLHEGRPARVLLLGPPGCGKTTILRDAAAYLAGECCLRVAVADEREELIPTDSCIDCDVLRGAEKADAVELLLRTMSPQVIVCDELGKNRDTQAMMDAVCAGVGVLASAHASSFDDAMKRPNLRELIGCRAFDRYVMLAPVGRCIGVMDALGRGSGRNGEYRRGNDGADGSVGGRLSAGGW